LVILESGGTTERNRAVTEIATTEMPNMAAAAASVAAGEYPLPLRSLLDAGVHFGHQTKRWNPKMRTFIYGARNGIHIIDLDQTTRLFKRAYDFIVDAVGRGGHVLFVGTKRQAQDIVIEEARRCGMYFVTNRWLGGTLTNFRTMKQGLDRFRTLERMKEDGTHEQLLKKEVVKLEKERERLEKYLGGLKGMGSVPAVVFVIDPHQESIAVSEARKLNVPVVAITDTNCDPDLIDFVIPGNDDAIRSIKLITSRIADACIEGAQRRRDTGDRDQDRGEGGEPQRGGRDRGPGGRAQDVSVYQGGRGRGPRGGGAQAS
jgi:small subunit ribosomal protein S2